MSNETMIDLLDRCSWARGRGGLSEQFRDPLTGGYWKLDNAYGIQRFRCRNLKRWKSGYWSGVFAPPSERR